jgi:hypothetical protein
MSQIVESILSSARTLSEGGLLSPKGFLHLASRAAVDKALSRLAQEGTLLRVSRGLYAMPSHGRFGTRPPSTESVVQGIEAYSNETVVASGAAEANALGLTTQVPTREVFLTTGVSRTLRLGKRTVVIRHANRWQMMLGKGTAGKVIRALAWVGPQGAPKAMKTLRATVPESEWKAVQSARHALPGWMAKVVSESLAHG